MNVALQTALRRPQLTTSRAAPSSRFLKNDRRSTAFGGSFSIFATAGFMIGSPSSPVIGVIHTKIKQEKERKGDILVFSLLLWITRLADRAARGSIGS